MRKITKVNAVNSKTTERLSINKYEFNRVVHTLEFVIIYFNFINADNQFSCLVNPIKTNPKLNDELPLSQN